MNSFFLIVIGLSMALFTSKAGADTRGECRCEYSWQHAYAEYINDLEYYSGLYIGDLNGDEIPEAVIDVNTLGSVIVLYDTREGRKELNLETVSAWGSVTYIADTGQFLYCPFYGHTTGTWGYEEYYLYDWTGEEYEQTFSMLRESGYYQDEENYEYGESFIDGKKTDNESFEKKLAEIEKLRDENSGNLPFWNLEEEGFEEKVRELLPCYRMTLKDIP